MIIVQGTHNSAVCHTDTLEKSVAGQIKAVCKGNIELRDSWQYNITVLRSVTK